MATIDLTLNSFIVPRMASLTPLWGTVQTDPDHPGLSTMESILDMMMPFNRMRPVVVTEDSTTTEVQANTEPSAGFISDWKSYRHDIGKYIWQVIAFAGLFFGAEDSGYEGGGKRPPFITGGVQEDQMRRITGNYSGIGYGAGPSGAFYKR
jgi:hypothetical protein